MCGLTFELSRAQRRGAWPAKGMIDNGRFAGQVPCRCASALERGVRPHLTAQARVYPGPFYACEFVVYAWAAKHLTPRPDQH